MRRPGISALLLVCALATGCAKQVDFRSPADRLTSETAWTEQPGVVRIDTGIGGTTTSELAISLGVTAGLPARIELSGNFAHYGLGMFNVKVRWNPVDKRYFGLGFSLGASVMRPQWMWYLQTLYPWLPGTFSKMTLLSFPFTVTGTFPVLDWLHLSVALGYEHVEVFGHVDGQILWFDGSIGSRRIMAGTTVQFFLGRRVALQTTLALPLARWTASTADSTATLQPGVVLGETSVDWEPGQAFEGWALKAWAEMELGKTHLQIGAGSSGILRSADIPVFPFLGLYWRI